VGTYILRDSGRKVPFSDEQLFDFGPPKTFTGEHLREIAFPLGGIGTGCVSMSGSGQLVDWEMFNRPNKGYRPDYTFFSLYARPRGGEPTFRVLEGRLQPPYQGYSHGAQVYRGFGFGPPTSFGSGLLRMAECAFTGYFPFCRVDLADEAAPVRASTEAWSPFLPLNDEDSSLPVAVFDVTVTNTTKQVVDATVALGLQNIVGWPEVGGSVAEYVEEDGARGIVMTTRRHGAESPRYGTLALLTPDEDVTWQLGFAEAHWFRPNEILMDEFGTTGEFTGPREPVESGEGQAEVAHLGIKATLKPGESQTRTFVLAWLNPNFEEYWAGEPHPVWKTYQGNRWADAAQVARYVIENRERLEAGTRKFADAFFSSTLPAYVLDAVSSQMAILRTPTVTRLPDGTLYGFEGCHAESGCCEGSCTHVWAYAQTIAHLFPRLERGMREIDFAYDLREEDGHMQFRMELPPGTRAGHGFHAAADGQMGNVLRTYREWQICGDDEWLAKVWPAVKKALEYAWVEWDADRDGVLEGVHHNTLDIEYYGAEPVCQSMYLAALRAGEEMAWQMGEVEAAKEYRRLFEAGRAAMDSELWDGEYYRQIVPEGCDAPFQYGPGCIIDQVLGQWHARMYGLGDIVDPEHGRSALASVFRYNFRDDFYGHHNPHRIYAINDDMGLLICTWPKGGRPKSSVTYAFECMIGFEYQVGAHLIYEGYLREGLTVCKAIRDRHDGLKRNPYNEFECGSHYARSMANYAYVTALAGWRYSAVERTMYLNPAIRREDFRCFFSTEGAWGMVRYKEGKEGAGVEIEVMEGTMRIEKVVVGGEELGMEKVRIVEAAEE
jgi:uncharacterized protein (DUF608 family)